MIKVGTYLQCPRIALQKTDSSIVVGMIIALPNHNIYLKKKSLHSAISSSLTQLLHSYNIQKPYQQHITIDIHKAEFMQNDGFVLTTALQMTQCNENFFQGKLIGQCTTHYGEIAATYKGAIVRNIATEILKNE